MALKTQEDIRQLKTNGDADGLSITLFAHKIDVGGKTQSLFENNAYTVCYIKDVKFLEVVAASQTIATTIINENNRIDGSKQKFESSSSFSVYANINVFDFFSKNTYVFTIGEQLDVNKVIAGEQEVFISRETLPSEINQKIGNGAFYEKLHDIDESVNATLYDLVNVQEVNSLSNSSLLFTYTPRIENPTDIKITYDKSWGRQRIFAKGNVDGKFTDIDLKIKDTSTKVGLLKMTPISILNKLTCFSDTLDLNISLPYLIGKLYKSPDGLRRQIVSGDTPEQWKKDLWQVFLSILELTKAFSNNFTEYSVENEKTGKLEIDPKQTIGGIKLGLLPSTVNAITAIDGRIENWKQSNPTQLASNEFKLFKTFILMLTPFIQSSLSLGGGLNQANRVYKLFWFDLRTSIIKGMADKDANDIQVQIKSDFYDIDATSGVLTLKEQFKELSKYQAIDVDGWASLAELPNSLEAMNRLGKPGDINVNSDMLTKYYIYVPYDDQDKLQEMYGSFSRQSGQGEQPIQKSVNDLVFEKYSDGNGDVPPISAYPTIDWNEQEIYNRLIKPNLSSNQKMQFIDGVPNIRNIHITTTHKSTGGGRTTPTYPEYSTSLISYRITTVYTLSFEYTILQTGNISQLNISAENAVQDKESFLDLNKYNFSSSDKVLVDAELSSRNQASTINSINQIIMDGLWGNEFDVLISNGTNTLTLNAIEFTSKFDETQTKTKLNL